MKNSLLFRGFLYQFPVPTALPVLRYHLDQPISNFLYNLEFTLYVAYPLKANGIHSLRFNCFNRLAIPSAYPIFTESGKEGFIGI